MPAPPPYGVSSTVRCRSWVQCRRSCTRTSIRPLSRALPGERELQRGEVVGEDRDDVDAHARLSPSSGSGVTSPGRSATTTRPPATSTSGTSAVTNGTSVSRPSGVRTASRSWAPPCTRPVTSPRRRAVDVVRREPDQLVVVELVGVLGRLVGRDRWRAARSRGPPRRRCGRAAPRSATSSTDWCQRELADGQRRAAGVARAAGAPRRAARRRARSAARARRCGRRRSPRRAGRAACRSGRRRPRCSPRSVPHGASRSMCKCRMGAAPEGDAHASGLRVRQRRRSTSTKSTRAPPRPASAEMTVRNAVAVRPPRPITLPRSSGCTRTSRIEPRRSCLSRTRDVVGVVDHAAHQVLERVGEHGLRTSVFVGALGSLGLGGGASGVSAAGASAGVSSACGLGRGLLGRRLAPWRRRPCSSAFVGVGLLRGGLLGHRLALGRAVRLLERLVEDLELVALRLRVTLQGALGARRGP